MTTDCDEIRLANFVNASSEGIFIHDKGLIVDINPSITTIYGYSPSETVGKQLLQFIAPESQAIVKENLAIANDGPYEVIIVAKNGHKIPSEVRARTLKYHGRSLRAVALLDITQRKLALNKLKESEQYNRMLFEQSTMGLALCLMDGKLVDVNPAYARIIGYSVEETLKLSYWEITPEKYMADEQVQLESLKTSGKYGPYEKEYRRKDGSLVPVRLNGQLIERDGEHLILSSVEDITQSKAAKDRIKANAERMQKLASLSLTLASEPTDVFCEIAPMIGEMLDVRVIYFTEIHDQTLNYTCVYADAEFKHDVGQSPLNVTPCAKVAESKDLHVFQQVSELFPQADFLKQYDAFSYCGFPVLDSNGKVKAITCLLDDKPHEFTEEDQALLRIFSQRIGMEIEKQRAANIIQHIAATISAQTGEAFFESLVTNLARLFDVDFIFIGVLDEQTANTIQTLAFCKHGEIVDNVNYELVNTPCAHVINSTCDTVCTFTQNVQQLFPNAPMLETNGIHSYIGVPLVNANGKPIGLICMMDNKPLENTGQLKNILRIFAVRAASEFERLQTEKELNHRKAEFEAMFNAIPDAVMFADLNRRIILTNPAVHKMFGYDDDELIGNTTEMLYANKEDYQQQGQLRYRQGPKTKKDAYEVKYKRKDGSEFWTESQGTQVKDANGSPIGFIGLFRDITERKKNEEDLLKSERHLANAQRLAHIGSWELDLSTSKLDWSKEVFNIFEIDPEKFSATYEAFLDVIHPDDRKVVNITYTESLKTHSPYQIEHRLQMPDGRIKYVLELGEHFYDEQGNPLRSMGTVQDITERVTAEIKIRYSEARLAESQEIAHLGSWDFNIKTGETIWSKEFYKLLGYEPDEVEPNPENFYSRVHKDDLEYVQQELIRPFSEEGHEYQAEYRVILPDDSMRILSGHGKIIYDAEGEPWRYVGTTLDVTERRAQEEKLRRSQKMDALGKLTGGIAHDYNNLLGIILGYTEQLSSQLGDNKNLNKYVRDIKNAAERGTRLTSKLLGFSKSKTFDTKVLEINTILREQQLILEKTLTARIKLKYDLAKNAWPVEVDSSELEDAILNLCINAKHAMSNGGEFSIRTRNKHLDEKDASQMNLAAGDYVEIGFCDTGVGMDKGIKERIFEPFFTTKGESGTGLGLSQVYGFVERSNGAILVYSEPGQGSRFVLYFPKSQQSFNAAKSFTEDGVTRLDGDETVLVVDDEQAMVELLQEILSSRGYHVLTANNGVEALKVLEKQSKPVDLIITDVIMPEMDGYQLAAQVYKQYPQTKIQMVSGFADDRHAAFSDENLHQNMLYKPYTIDTLLSRIRTVLDNNKGSTDSQVIPNNALAGRTVLVLDDDEDIQNLYKLNLNKLGCTTFVTGDEKETLDLYRHSLENGEPIDVVIVDLTIPGGQGGKAVANEIHSLNPKAKVIVSSGHTESPEMKNYQDFGFQGALEKTFNRKKIREVLEQVLAED